MARLFASALLVVVGLFMVTAAQQTPVDSDGNSFDYSKHVLDKRFSTGFLTTINEKMRHLKQIRLARINVSMFHTESTPFIQPFQGRLFVVDRSDKSKQIGQKGDN